MFDCYLVCKLRYNYFHIGGGHLGFFTSGLVVQYSECFNIVFIRLLYLKNAEVAVEIALLSGLQAEI